MRLLTAGSKSRRQAFDAAIRVSTADAADLCHSGEGSYDRGQVPEAHHNLRAASAFSISFRRPYLWNGTTKNS